MSGPALMIYFLRKICVRSEVQFRRAVRLEQKSDRQASHFSRHALLPHLRSTGRGTMASRTRESDTEREGIFSSDDRSRKRQKKADSAGALHIQQGLDPRYSRQYRCAYTFTGSTLEGVQKPPCLAAGLDHDELLVVCLGCKEYNPGDGLFRAHCVHCYAAFQRLIPSKVAGTDKARWSLESSCPQEGSAGKVYKALNFVDWSAMARWRAESHLPKEVPIVQSLVEGLTAKELAAVRNSIAEALSFHPKSKFLEKFPSERRREFKDVGMKPNRQQLFGFWQNGACPSCCQVFFPPPRPLQVDPDWKAKAKVFETEEIVLENVPLASLSVKAGKVLVLETRVSRAIEDEAKVNKLSGRFQEDLGNIGIKIFQEDPKYRRMIKTSPTDTTGTYDAVFSLIRTDEGDSQLVSIKMLHVLFNFLKNKYGSDRNGRKKAQKLLYNFFGILRQCGWYLNKPKETTPPNEASKSSQFTDPSRREACGSKRKVPPTPKSVNKGMKSLAAAALAKGLRKVSQRSDRINGALGHAGHLTLKDIRLAVRNDQGSLLTSKWSSISPERLADSPGFVGVPCRRTSSEQPMQQHHNPRD